MKKQKATFKKQKNNQQKIQSAINKKEFIYHLTFGVDEPQTINHKQQTIYKIHLAALRYK